MGLNAVKMVAEQVKQQTAFQLARFLKKVYGINNVHLPKGIGMRDILQAAADAFQDLNLHTLSTRLIECDIRNVNIRFAVQELNKRMLDLLKEIQNTDDKAAVNIKVLWKTYIYLFQNLALKHLANKIPKVGEEKESSECYTYAEILEYRENLGKVFKEIARKPLHDLLVKYQYHDKRTEFLLFLFNGLSLDEIYKTSLPLDSYLYASIKSTPLFNRFKVGLVGYSERQPLLRKEDIFSVIPACRIDELDVEFANIIAHYFFAKTDIRTELEEGSAYPVILESLNSDIYLPFRKVFAYVIYYKKRLTVIIAHYTKIRKEFENYNNKVESFVSKNNLQTHAKNYYQHINDNPSSGDLIKLMNAAIYMDIFQEFGIKTKGLADLKTVFVDTALIESHN